MDHPPDPVEAPAGVNPATDRLTSVDALRGFDMLWIMGGDSIVEGVHEFNHSPVVNLLATQLTHKKWEGFAFYDLIFPLFVFLVGVSITFSLSRIIERQGKTQAHIRVFKRGLLLVVLGVLYYKGISGGMDEVRWFGVLQRIGLCYLFAALIYINFKPRGIVIWFFVLLIGYWALMTFVPMPGRSTVSFDMNENISNWVDLHYVPGRLNDKTWDPEGPVSTIPAICTALLGIFAGFYVQSKQLPEKRKVMILVGGGIAMVLLGFLWGLQFPVIKKIWTSSYVLVAGGYSCILLGLFYLVIDVWKYRRWTTPFLWIGANALTAYVGVHVIRFYDMSTWLIGDPAKLHTGNYHRVMVAALSLILPIIMLRYMYKKRIFLRL